MSMECEHGRSVRTDRRHFTLHKPLHECTAYQQRGQARGRGCQHAAQAGGGGLHVRGRNEAKGAAPLQIWVVGTSVGKSVDLSRREHVATKVDSSRREHVTSK
mgnify:CR=1 FL=1